MKSPFLLSLLAAAAIAPPAFAAEPTYQAAAVKDTVIVLSPGAGRVDVVIQYRNAGTATWQRDEVRLGTSNPENAVSPFYLADSWLAENRVAFAESAVAPGEIAHFRFAVSPPLTDAKQEFRLVREAAGFFGPTITVQNHGTPEQVGVAAPAPRTKNGPKKVEINLANNTLTMWEGEVAIATHRISPGTAKTPTPTGTFKVLSKEDVRYSKTYKLYMPYWNHFGNGYGIHGLPYWKRGKRIVVEGASHIGRNVSHGCVRLPPGADKQFFEWATPGTPIWIHR